MSTDPNQLQQLQQTLMQSQDPNFPVPRGETVPLASFKVNGPNLLDRLQQIAGFIGVGGGTAANIIAAKNRTSPTGNSSISMGLDQLRNASKDIQDKEAQVKVSKFLPLLKDENLKYLANQLNQHGDSKGALDIINNSYSKDEQLRRTFASQNNLDQLAQARKFHFEVELPAQIAGAAADLEDKRINDPKNFTKADQARLSSFTAYQQRLGMPIEPADSPKKDILLVKNVAQPISNANEMDYLVDKVASALKNIPTGRLLGREERLKYIIEQNPELAQFDIMKRVLDSKITRGVMGEGTRHAVQIENQLDKLLFNANMSPKEIDSVANGLKIFSKSTREDARSAYLGMSGASEEGFNRYLNKIKRPDIPEAAQPSYDKLGVGETTLINGVKVKRIK